jgi:P-type conjugative transfer protein TrbJ
LVTDARSRWQTSMDGYRQTMTVQSQVVGNVQSDRGLLDALVTQSQGSVGALQVQQATNQLLALSIKRADFQELSDADIAHLEEAIAKAASSA